MSILSQRPRGVRKSWKRVVPGVPWALSIVGPYIPKREDQPVETLAFYDRQKRLRRVELAWADGSTVRRSFTKSGSVIRIAGRPQ